MGSLEELLCIPLRWHRRRRCWAFDGSLLVAGLYDGSICPVNLSSGEVGRIFHGRHADEVVCLDVSSECVLSGSGDPGYYNRQPSDASVKLHSRSDGRLLGTMTSHRNSVRGVVLLPQLGGVSGYALSADLDGRVILMSL